MGETHRDHVPELSVVVLSYRNDDTVLAAIDSLLAQSTPIEVVLSHSGGGPTPERVGRTRPSVRIVASEARRSCSEARNAGVEECRGEFIAFLEADCLAEPGWAEGRLREHRAGAAAVASAVTNGYPHSRSAWASHLLRYQRRFPETPAHERLMLGLSCHRSLFEEFGPFRADLRGAEDSEFTTRLLEQVDIAWAGDVRSAHRNADDPLDLMRDHFRRGVRNAHARMQIDGGPHTLEAAGEALANVPRALAWGRRLAADGDGLHPLRSWPLLAPATGAYLAGLVAGRRGAP